ncbi:hypothetical protein [Singulisphaera acidiphila]|uniref:Uncharacterized protein n=1 Tax=Singulisphaera acidiphila (strain ATCC BAA-1392 / DSM 18658 / VKM B-2454 / MOB10) TaxID=886293 RepID=L0D871_SINAD|nr:hypothetical protein [Singulisphaera acidiphila]AGA25023.1 hypothetical protein Sinac_0602 [Singulisphaera acidiphila DSM 18658]
MLNALERLAGSYGRDCEHLKADIAVKQGQLGDYEARLGKPFAHTAYMDELANLRDQLEIRINAGLAGERELGHADRGE